MVEAIVSSTVEMLRDLLIQEASLLAGVKNQVEEMKEELERMQCFLKDADRRSYEDEVVHNRIKSIWKLAYRIEDVLETYALKVESRKDKGTLKRFACLFEKWASLHKLGSEIGRIKNKIARITSSLQTYGIKSENEGQSSNAASKNLLRQTFAHEIDENFVGMQNDIDILVALMTDRDEGHQIISIYGMGGSGKTTLAKQVFNHKVIQNNFESFAWVALSQQFDIDNVLKDILRQLDPRRDKNVIERMKYVELVREINEFQREKKCLVVLDDIWKTKDWDVLRSAFPTTSVDCRVLLTTRIQGVAEIGIPHKLNLFSEEEGWQLLTKRAMTGKNAPDSNLQAEQEKLGKEMVRKCGRLPLAISVIGGILRKKETLEEWQKVNKDIDSYLRCGEGVEQNDQVMQILTLSYEDLPYQLKPCLLYLAYYPEDAEIDLRNLYCMWIAEGMILSEDQRSNESLMEVAERYLNVLASRSLVQVQLNEEISGTSKSCRLHDLIRDLCLSKCNKEEFLKVIDLRESKQPKYDLNSLGGKAYRLVIYGSEDVGNVYSKFLHVANEGTRVFSLRNLKRYSPIACEVSKDLRRFRFLRVVAFEGLDFSNTKVLHEVIKKLIHLRCLSFELCKLNEVPSSVGELTYLQTFHLRCEFLDNVKIPNVFWKLKRLLHFVLLGEYGTTLPSKSWRLDFFTGLETLICFDTYRPTIEALSELTNLKVFESFVDDNKILSMIITCIESNWRSKRDITLKISGECDFIGTEDGPILLHKLFLCHAVQNLAMLLVCINELPKYESGMLASSSLVVLSLLENHIKEDPMPTLEKLPKLKRLRLEPNSFDGKELICSSIGFPNLKELSLFCLPNLKKWRIDDGAMPNLSTVSIGVCFELEMIPSGMKFLKTLRKLDIFAMPKKFNDRIRIVNGEEGVDLHKVSHVPEVDISDEVTLSGISEVTSSNISDGS